MCRCCNNSKNKCECKCCCDCCCCCSCKCCHKKEKKPELKCYEVKEKFCECDKPNHSFKD